MSCRYFIIIWQKNKTLSTLKFITASPLKNIICVKCVDFAAICDGQITSTGACQNTADGGLFQLIKGTRVFTSSGQCNEPEVCSNCGSGFYADGPKCKSKVYLVLFTSSVTKTLKQAIRVLLMQKILKINDCNTNHIENKIIFNGK